MAGNETEELVIRYLSELRKAIASPASLSVDLFSSGVIPRKVYNDAVSHDGSFTTEQKTHAICDALLQSVAIKPNLLVEFVEVAEDNSPALSDVCARIKREPLYGEFSTARNHVLFAPCLFLIFGVKGCFMLHFSLMGTGFERKVGLNQFKIGE